MGKQGKATRKFEKKHLKETIDRRKDFAKIKQRHQKNDKRKQRNAARAEKEADSESESEGVDEEKIDVNNDQFFQEALSLPEVKTSEKKTKSQTGKRKHEELELTEQNGIGDGASDDEDDLDMAALAQKDPEFHKYLQENDPELLDFNEDDNLEELEFSEDEDEHPSKKRKTIKGTTPSDQVTIEQVRKWKTSMQEQHSIRALREVVLAFRAAAHMDDEDSKDFKYTIPSSDVYHEVLMTALKDAPKVLSHHLPIKESKAGKLQVPTNTSQFKKLSPLIRTFSTSLNHLLAGLSDSATLRLTLQSFEPLLPYLLQFRKFLKQILRSVAGTWSDNTYDEATRITAFLILRRLLTIGDAGIKEAVLKSTYENLIKGSRNTTAHTITGINLMKNSAAELWGIDQKVAYTTGFTFIRQAAMHLRTNITKPTKDSYKTIYNWQFIHSLDFWSRVLSTHCNSLLEAEKGKQSELRPLIYPVVQITLGVMRLIPTSTYFPLRFQLIRSLLRISQSTGTYIPLSSALLEVLQSSELRKPASNKSSTNLKSLDFTTSIRAPSAYSKTRIYQDGLGEQTVELLSEFFVLWAKNIAFPELQLPIIVMLKRWLKNASRSSTGNRNGKMNQQLLLLVQKSEANSRWILERRNQVTFSPRDRSQVEKFLKDVEWTETPIGAFVAGQREFRERKNRTVIEGRKEEEKRRRQAQEDDGEDEIEVA